MSLIDKPHVFTGRVVNGTAICAFCSATPLEAAYALGPTCPQPPDATDELQTQLEAMQAEIDRLSKQLRDCPHCAAIAAYDEAIALMDRASLDRQGK